MKKIIRLCFYLIIGATLAYSEIYWNAWQFWVVLLSVTFIDVISGLERKGEM